jgi:hypothetical protein
MRTLRVIDWFVIGYKSGETTNSRTLTETCDIHNFRHCSVCQKARGMLGVYIGQELWV